MWISGEGGHVPLSLLPCAPGSRQDWRSNNTVTVREWDEKTNLNVKACDHISPALYQLHWLPVDYRIQYKLCPMMHGVYVRRCPKYLDQTVQLADSVRRRRGLRSSVSADLRYRYVVPTTRTKLGKRAFSVASPTAWNTLPADIRRTTDTVAFKRQLNTHYFN